MSADFIKDINFRTSNFTQIKIGQESFEEYLIRCVKPNKPDIRSQQHKNQTESDKILTEDIRIKREKKAKKEWEEEV